MLRERGSDFQSLEELDSYGQFLDTQIIHEYNVAFNFPEEFVIKMVEPGDRTYHWDPSHLFEYRDALLGGLRFPVHPFIPKLLADIQISPCQLVPNGWRLVHCFLVQCSRKELEPTVPVFRKIFQFKNSAISYPGWVYISHRPGVPHIFNPASIPDNNIKWKDEFLKLEWKGGDWGTLFRKSFSRVQDGSANTIKLTEAEQVAYNKLVEDDGRSLGWELLDEFTLKSVGLSRVSDEGR